MCYRTLDKSFFKIKILQPRSTAPEPTGALKSCAVSPPGTTRAPPSAGQPEPVPVLQKAEEGRDAGSRAHHDHGHRRVPRQAEGICCARRDRYLEHQNDGRERERRPRRKHRPKVASAEEIEVESHGTNQRVQAGNRERGVTTEKQASPSCKFLFSPKSMVFYE